MHVYICHVCVVCIVCVVRNVIDMMRCGAVRCGVWDLMAGHGMACHGTVWYVMVLVLYFMV